MRILVIGGTGFIGPAVVTSLAEAGNDVTIFHRGQHEVNLPSEVRHVHGNWEDPRGFASALPHFREEFRRLAPDVVLYMTPADTLDCDAVMHVFRGIAGRVTGISSCDVYRVFGRLHRQEPGPPDPIPLSEDAPLREKLYAFSPDYENVQAERVLLGDPDLAGTV